jgi:glucose/arabinose dehydrogenase
VEGNLSRGRRSEEDWGANRFATNRASRQPRRVTAVPRYLLAAAAALVPLVGLPQSSFTRLPASSLTLPAEAPAASYSTPAAFPGLSFSQPVAVVSPPGETRRLFVVEKTGRIWLIPDVTAPVPSRTLFLDLSGRVAASGTLSDERGLLSLAFHPDFARNRFFYLWYTLNATTAAGSGLHNRLARFEAGSGDPSRAEAASEVPLITQRDDAGNHNGGQILFGPEGLLYLSLGDEGGANDAFQNSQRIDRDFFAGIIRIDVDARPGSLAPSPHPAVHAGAYRIPPDNPFVGASAFNGSPVAAASVRTEFWATGLRNPWRMAFDPATGDLWCADVGQDAREEINLVVRGGNYGWSYREGTLAGPRANPPSAATFQTPVWEYPRSQGVSVTGGIVVRGGRDPSLFGHYLFADYLSGRIWALLPDGPRPVAASRVRQLATLGGISSFGIDPSGGDVLITVLGDGSIRRLVASASPGGQAFPVALSATGAFRSLATLEPQPGLVPYTPRVSFWSDHATKRRWFALRDATSRFGFAADSPWSLPAGAVWVKHFDLELTRGDPATARRIETRFLVKTSSGIYGLSYRWNERQDDAELVADAGEDRTFLVNENGTVREQVWRFPSRTECLVCHTAVGGHALSFNTRQLNGTPAPGGSQNTLLPELARAGYLDVAAVPAAASLPRLAAADDPSASIEARARSYLDVNCAGCHQPQGPALGFWDARFSSPLTQAGIVNGLLATSPDPGARVLAPGDPARSQLLQRILSPGPGRMPPVAGRERDASGEALLRQWISALAFPSRPAAVINLSTRAAVGAGGDILIGGFVASGTGIKSLLLRGVGPGLSAFGVAGTLPRPHLTLLEGSRIVAENSGWASSPAATAIRQAALTAGAFPLAEGGADSALLANVPAGAYTVQLRDAGGSSGIGLIEVYDLDPYSLLTVITPSLVNTSVRARVGTGAAVVIPGVVVGSGSPRAFLVRAVGPGLRAFGVSDTLARPRLDLFRGSEILATNSRWTTASNLPALREAIQRAGAFPLSEDAEDSALLATLESGAYTVQVSGADGGQGVALVEVYELR